MNGLRSICYTIVQKKKYKENKSSKDNYLSYSKIILSNISNLVPKSLTCLLCKGSKE